MRNQMKKIGFSSLMTCALLMGATLMTAQPAFSKNVQNECGGAQWVSTGQKGPYGYTWYYDSSQVHGTAPNPVHICANFYNDLNNCNTAMPKTAHGYTYTQCDYDTGIYHLIASAATGTTDTYCQNC